MGTRAGKSTGWPSRQIKQMHHESFIRIDCCPLRSPRSASHGTVRLTLLRLVASWQMASSENSASVSPDSGASLFL